MANERVKFQRDYVLQVEKNSSVRPSSTASSVVSVDKNDRDEDFVFITPPLTVEFNIVRTELSSQNISTIRVYNLAKKTRDELIKDQWDFDNIKVVKFNAGYQTILGNVLPLAFSGNATRVFSVREGSNYITQIEAFDAGSVYVNANISRTFKKGQTYKSIIKELMEQMAPFGVKLGKIEGDYSGALKMDRSFYGSLTDVLKELTGDTFFIDNRVVHAIQEDKFVPSPGGILKINSESGLLSTPKREETFLTFDIVFEPRINIGVEIDLESITGENYNGKYKVISVTHKGMISESVPSKAITSVGVYLNRAKTIVSPEFR